MNNIIMKGLAVLFIQFLFINGAFSASCKGPHANDPGCITPSATTSPISINSVSVDWLNERILVVASNASLNASDITATVAGVTAAVSEIIDQSSTQQLVLLFPSTTLPKGNHNLVVSDSSSSSSDSISLFAKGEMVDPALIGCPCEPTSGTGWSSTLSPLGLWNKGTTTTNTTGTVCYELVPGGSGNPVDVAATILGNPDDPTAYPVYPIGAAFTEDPNESVCQLTEVDKSGVTNLVKIRINRQQQAACRNILATNICNSITPVSSVPSF
jgi:hypothetical protein